MFIAVPMKMLCLHSCKCGVFTENGVYFLVTIAGYEH